MKYSSELAIVLQDDLDNWSDRKGEREKMGVCCPEFPRKFSSYYALNLFIPFLLCYADVYIVWWWLCFIMINDAK